MKLFYSPFHSLVHKSLVVIQEKGLVDQVTLVPTFPFRNTQMEDCRGLYPLTELNPLGKVPTLALEDGTALYGSQVVAEYLDSLNAHNPLFPTQPSQRWDALRRLALGDTLFELGVQMGTEGRIPKAEPRPGLYEWLQPKIEAAFDVIETDIRDASAFDIGHIAFLQGISYTGGGYFSRLDEPLYPRFDWREGRPALLEWYEASIQRPSVAAYLNKPFEGDSSPAFFRQQMDQVLASRRA
ncbi:MAG: glutathione S-transferase family protein [Gammaproteobacteria bacterium]